MAERFRGGFTLPAACSCLSQVSSSETRGADAGTVVESRGVGEALGRGLRHGGFLCNLCRSCNQIAFLYEVLVSSINLCRNSSAEVACIGALDVVVMAAGAFDVECLRDGRKAKELVFFEIFAEEFRLVPVQAIFAVASLTPTAEL